MSFIKKSDIKNHLSDRRHKGPHIAPAIPSDTKAVPITDRDVDETDSTRFAKDFTSDHTTDRPGNDSIDSRKPKGFVAAGAAKM